MATGKLGRIEGQLTIEVNEGIWLFDDDDWALIAMLRDPIFCAELLFEDPLNTDYAGCYTVRDYQYPLFRSRKNYNIAPCARDVGKAQPLDAGVLTPGGFRTMGSLKVGDEVIGSDGKPTRVLAVYPQGERPIYRVTFSDGSWTECDAEHLWTVTCDSHRTRGKAPVTMTLKQISDSKMQWHAPIVEPVEFATADELPVHPYVLGCLLGDGGLTGQSMVRLTSADPELVGHFANRLPSDVDMAQDGRYDWRLRSREPVYAGWGRRQPHTVLRVLRELELLGKAAQEKSIPESYLLASIEDRLDLLRGLVDTGGAVVRHTGGIDYSTASAALAEDIRFLVASLGGRCSAPARGATTGRDRYRLYFRMPDGMCPCLLSRKADVWLAASRWTNKHRTIVDIEAVGVKPAQCIRVAAPDSLYVTDDFILTHNTESIKAKAVSHIFKRLGEGMLLSAPQMIHLDPLTKEVEERITKIRLTSDFLKKDSQRTGFVHNPFRADFIDGTAIIGRIPHLDGKGVKGQHVPDLIIDECFPAGTLVLTSEGQTPIEKVQVGDYVLTHRGRWRRVTATACRERETCEITGQGMPALTASVNHPFWVKRLERRGDRRRDGHQRRIFGDAEFVRAADLAPPTVADNEVRIGARFWSSPCSFPVAPLSERPPVPTNSSFWWLVGFYMAEGSVSERGDQVTFSVHRDEVEMVCDALRQIGLAGVTVHYDHDGARICPQGAMSWARWLARHVGRIGCEKEVKPWLLSATEEVRRLVLEGYVSGEGNMVRDTRYAAGGWQATAAHKRLALSMKLLAQSLGYFVSLYRTGARGWYQLRGSVRSQTAFTEDDKVFSLVRRVVPTGRREKLYDLTVEDDHSFIANSCVVSNSQDYPEQGWTEVFPTVMKDHTDHAGGYDFTMTFYGVHGAGQGGTFGRLAKSPAYDMTVITRLQTPKWGKEEKAATAAMYGGTNSPDYRRNVLGEPGQAFSQFFATARLLACLDQDADSRYNTLVFKEQEWQAEEVDSMLGANADVGDLLDLPSDLGQQVFCGMDIGLVSDPTVIMIFAVLPDKNKKSRLQLIRMFHLWRFRERQIRQAVSRIGRQYGLTLRSFGYDMTGLGLPIFQAMEDDEDAPQHLKDVSHGYVFNAKVPVSVDRNYVSEQGKQLVDQYGNIVEIVRDKWTGQESMVVRMTMIEASTRYLRGFVDDGFMLLPFHDKLISDFQGETEQRVKAMAGVKKKPSAFHMLDAARAMAMGYKQGEVEEQVYSRPQVPVMDRAVLVRA